MRVIKILLLLSACWPVHLSKAQTYSLEYVVNLARESSLSRLQSDNRRKNREWEYEVFKADFKPSLLLTGTLPNFNRSIDPIVQNDGTERFVERSLASSELSLHLNQPIALTGGSIYVGSQLQRIDLFAAQGNTVNYAVFPFSLGFSQPLSPYNPLRWRRQIEPLYYEEAIKEFAEELEQIAYQVTDLFFQVLMAQENHQLAIVNLENSEAFYRIGLQRFEITKINQSDLYQLELNLVNAGQQRDDARIAFEESVLRLKTFLGLNGNEEFSLELPVEVWFFGIDENTALNQARENRQQHVAFKRRQLEAEQKVVQARGETGIKLNLRGSMGFTNQSDRFTNLLGAQQSQQRISIGMEVPILDWGRQKARVQSAMANRELEQVSIHQEEANFDQEIRTMVRKFPILHNRVISGGKAAEISNKNYDIAIARFKIDKISIMELNMAMENRDRSNREYLQALRDFWLAYYEIRMLTLYDFRQGTKLKH